MFPEFPEFPEITDISDFTAWTQLAAISAGFTGDQNLIQALSVNPEVTTVGEYLALLDASEAAILETDFSFLQTLLPTIETQILAAIDPATLPAGVTADEVVDEALGFLTDLSSGDTSLLTQSFDAIRAALDDVPADTLLIDGLLGDTGGGGVGPGTPIDPDAIVALLEEFFQVRLPSDVVEAWVSGDPHLRTLDGVDYDFQAAGEFVLLRGTDSDFEIQARMVPVADNVSVNQAIATRLDGQAVMIDAADASPLSVNGEVTELADGASISVGNGVISREGDVYRIIYPGDDDSAGDGDSQLSVRVTEGRVDIGLRMDDSLLGDLEGLLGDGDGDVDNDVALADGTPLARPLAFDDLYGQYRDDWRVAEADSLFTYDAGETTDGFYDAAFPGEEVSLETLDEETREAAEAAAEAAGLVPGTVAFETAVLDFALTGDESFIDSALFLTVAADGTEGNDTLVGGTGDDVLNGLGGDDRLEGGEGNDQLSGGDGDDGLLGGAGADEITGGSGNDNIAASSGNDTANGEGGDDLMGGGEGDDAMSGGGGDDFMGGGLGDDTVDGGGDNDVVNGGAGDDELQGGAGNDTMGGSFGFDLVSGGDGDDDMGGGAGQDTMTGGAGNDTLGGGEAADVVQGNGGNDFLAGGGGADTIRGGAGDDTINAGSGDDDIAGGDGADVFVFNGFTAGDDDVIADFEDGVDSFRMVGVQGAAGTGLQGKLDALSITDAAGGAQIDYQGHRVLIEGVAAADLGLDDFLFV